MRHTWKDILSKYPNEHVVIAEPSFSPNDISKIEEGDVIDHDPVLDDLLGRCNLSHYESYALKYTGDLGKAIGQRGMLRIIEHD